ncbi:TIGR03087 family PEP-CTERM/XrtA system glycosyltransferase [Aurantiacibacter sediminis]|uniref:TIGR03087 family PEP-CTERM/XrtA system glycosyltransferase n=1 Tax=Aurantiacibacter sediminis TaxID=2793064 RepID=UPI002D80666C|nr:TIGR03087 family PEP-CTERM/XrtA system glycosyltransferase [Aurantiacibacter sediminis]
MSGDILFLAHRLPFPPDRGDKIRSHHILKALAQIAPVHVGCLAEDERDFAHQHELIELAASFCMPRGSKSLLLAGCEAIVRREPVSFSAFRSPDLHDWVRKALERENIGAIYVFSGQMAQYVPDDWAGRLIVDLVDVDSAKFEAYASHGLGPRALIDAREWRMLRKIEADLAARADATLLVSEAEADLLRSRVPRGRNIRALSNGIDCNHFDPASVTAESFLASDGPHYVFTGQMDYAPNIDAVSRMTQAIMPQIRRFLPDAQFHIVGRAPNRAVQALNGQNGTSVVGEVPDTRPWLAGADVVVAPLTIARGVQNKVIEAMAMARPVIVSPDAATGIPARSNQHFVIAEDDSAFVAKLLRLAEETSAAKELGTAARQFVVDHMGWPAMLADLPKLMGVSASEKQAERDAA